MYIQTRMVQSSEIGKNFVLRIFDLINMIQDVEGLHIDHLDKLNMESQTENFAIVLNFRHIKINRLPCFKEEIKLQTAPYDTKPFYGYRNTIIYDANHEPIIESYCVGSFIKLDGLKPHRLSKETLESIIDEEAYPMNYIGRKINTDGYVETGIMNEFVVQESFIDYYQHLNNAYYVDFAVNLLPKDFKINHISGEYKIPFEAGDTIILKQFHKNDSYLIKFIDHEQRVHALIEFN